MSAPGAAQPLGSESERAERFAQAMRGFAWFWLALPAAALEASALYLLIDVTHGDRDLAAFFLLHGAASLLFAAALRGVLPLAFRDPALPVLALLAAFVFFIPLFGVAGVAAALAIPRLIPKPLRYRPFAAVRPPEYATPAHEAATRLRPAGLRGLLLDARVAPETRMKSLVAMQNMPVRVAGPLLRRLLSDPSEDLRLTAYGMVEGMERRIQAVIDRERAVLAGDPEPVARLTALRRLAEQYNELVYAQLVQGDLRRFAIGQGLACAREAVALAPGDAGILFLRGRLEQAAGDLAAAEASYRAAMAAGLVEARVLPYLAEIAYARGDYARVRECLAPLARGAAGATMTPVVRFWAGGARD